MIVPAYNAQATLAEAVESAVAGTFRNIEVIIVDDGSTDDTCGVAEAFAKSDARVKLVRRANGGVSAAFNSGLAVAKGDYVARLDSDDLWHPAKLERQIELAKRDPETGFIYTFVRYVDAKGRVRHDGPDQRFPRRALCRGFYESLVGANSSALMRRSAVTQFGGYDEDLVSWEDLLLQLRISARAPVAFIPEYLVGYRVRPSSLSADVTGMVDSWRKARRKIRDEFADVPAMVHRWAHGRRCADFAEAFAWRSNYLACLRLLAEAALVDWAWTSRLLRYRSVRRLRRGFAAAAPRAPGPLFRNCDPLERLSPPSAHVGGALQALEAERIARITEIDSALAAAEARD